MKMLRFVLFALITVFAMSCVDEHFTPRDGGGEDDPIKEGGTGGGGSGGSGGSGGGH